MAYDDWNQPAASSYNPYDEYGGWLQYVDGEGGPPQAQLGHIGGAMEMFDPSVTARYGLPDLRSSSYGDWARAGAASGLGYQNEAGKNEQGQGGEWIYLTKDGQRTGDRAFRIDTPYNYFKELILPGAAVLGGGYLLGGALGSGAAGAAAGGAGGSAGAAGTLGASYIPTAVAPMTAAPLTGGLSSLAAALPELSTIGSALGGAGGIATLGASLTPTAVAPFTASPIAGGMSAAASSLPELSALGGLGGMGAGTSVKDALYGNAGYGEGMTGAQTKTYDAVLNATGSKTVADAVSSIPGLSSLTDLVGGNWGSVVGGLLGAVGSKGGTQTQERAPWAAAQPFLTGLLADADAARQQLKAQPFTPQQTAAYNAGYDLTNQARGLLGSANTWAQNGMSGGFNWNRKG